LVVLVFYIAYNLFVLLYLDMSFFSYNESYNFYILVFHHLCIETLSILKY